MMGSIGWLCPKCSAVISPYETVCTKCAPVSGIGTIGGWAGTYTLSGMSFGSITFGPSLSGTVMARPKADPKDAKLKEWRGWRDKVVELRDELDELIEEVEDDDE